MQGHYLTHFAAMLQIKLNFLVVRFTGHLQWVRRAGNMQIVLLSGGGGGEGGLIIGCIFCLQVNLFITGGLLGGGGGAYKRLFTALLECFSFSLLFYSILKS